MIELTKLNGAKVLVNCELIRTVEAIPDTVIRFIDGETLMVREGVGEVAAKSIEFKRSVNGARSNDKELPAWT